MAAEFIVTAVLLIHGGQSHEWLPYSTLDHRMTFENVAACESANDQMGDEIAAFLTQAIGDFAVAQQWTIPGQFRVSTNSVCREWPA